MVSYHPIVFLLDVDNTLLDALAAELREVYPRAVAEFVDLFRRVAANERWCKPVPSPPRWSAASEEVGS